MLKRTIGVNAIMRDKSAVFSSFPAPLLDKLLFIRCIEFKIKKEQNTMQVIKTNIPIFSQMNS